MVKYYTAVGRNVNGPETMNELNTQVGLQREISSYLQGEISAYKTELDNAAKIFGVDSNEYRNAKIKLQEMQTALTESNTAIYELRNQMMDLNFKPLDFAMSKLQSFGKYLENIVTLNKKRSVHPTEGDYEKQVSNNNSMIEIAYRQFNQARDNIINNGLEENSEEYQKWIQIYRTARDTIIELRSANEDLKVSILDARWKSFDDLHKKIDQTISDFEWLIKQIGDAEIFDDDGKGWNLTSKGVAAISMLGETMSKHKGNIADYREAIEDLNRQLEQNPEMADVINERIEEYIQKIKDESDALEENKDKLIDYYKTGIQNENEALQENIKLRSEALSKQKEYNDYAKQLQNQNRNRNKILAQINALQGSSNLQARAEVARLREQLYEADEELSDTRKNHRYDLLSKGYSQLADDANEALDKTLRAVDANSDMQERIVENMLSVIKTDYQNAYDAINDIISDTGVVIHDKTKESINDLTSVTSALGLYSNAVLEIIKTSSSQTAKDINTNKIITDTDLSNTAENAMLNYNEEALKSEASHQKAEQDRQRQEKINSLNQQIASYENDIQSINNQIPQLEQSRDKNYTYYQNRLKRADKNKSEGDNKKRKENLAAAQKHLTNYNNLNERIQTLKVQRDNDQKAIQELKDQLEQLNSYKRGTKGTLFDELAWTHEGEIIRRSDGAILRQLPTGTQVIPKIESENLLKWAQIDPFKQLKDMFDASHVINTSNSNSPVFYYDSIIHIDGNVDSDMMDRVEQLAKALLNNRDFMQKQFDYNTQNFKRAYNKRA